MNPLNRPASVRRTTLADVAGRRSGMSDEVALPTSKSDVRPAATEGADWQSGVTPGHARFRVLLNGEPVPGAVAAKASTPLAAGWVDVARGSDHADLRYEADDLGERMGEYVKRRPGSVTLVRCRPEE